MMFEQISQLSSFYTRGLGFYFAYFQLLTSPTQETVTGSSTQAVISVEMELTMGLQFTPNYKFRTRFSSFPGASMLPSTVGFSQPRPITPPIKSVCRRGSRANVSKVEELLRMGDGNEDEDDEEEGSSGSKRTTKKEDPFFMDADERKEWRQKIRDVIDRAPDVEEETDLLEKRKRMQKLLAEYPLVVEEEDPDWPEDADGWGFNLGQFFNKISIKNVKKEDDDDDDSDNEIVWKDDDYIRPIKDITTAEWEEAVFKDISPLVVLVHNRYRRPKQNEKIRDELEKAVHIIWNCSLPSPRCVAIDANTEFDLVSALRVSVFPELIFTKAGKILHREKAIRTADELSKIMAFYYYGSAKPPCLIGIKNMEEVIPSVDLDVSVDKTNDQ